MSCLHPYSDFAVRFRSRWIVSCLVLVLRVWCALGQNVNLNFPVFNDSTFTCTGIPYVVGYGTCFFIDAGEVEVLPAAYNNLYPNQAARFMYSTPVVFENPTGTVQASFSTFFIFSISHVANQLTLGGGFAFMVAPEINTPDNSASGGFGMFPINPKTGKATSTTPMVMGVEFDTRHTAGIDVVAVPHIGIDIKDIGGNTALSSNATHVDPTGWFDVPLGMWIDYNSTLLTLSVFCVPVNGTDGSAVDMKPDTPVVTMGGLRVQSQLNRRSYVGFGASVFWGGFEENILHFWSFQTFGFPPSSLLAQWYQWWAPLSTTAKVGLIAGAVVGTVGGAYLCSECLFFCFFKRIKDPQSESERRWPVRRRESLPGTRTKKVPPRKKVRDSLSVANPLYLWEAPLEPAEDPDADDPENAAEGTILEEAETSENEDTPLMSPPDIEEGEPVQSEAEGMDDEVGDAVDEVEEMAMPRRPSVRRESTKSVAVQKGPANAVSIERTPSPVRRKSMPEVAKAPASPTEKKMAAPPQSPIQRAKPGSPPQQKPSQAPRKPSLREQGAKRSAPPQQRPAQAAGKPSQGERSASPQQRPAQTPKGAKPASPLREGQSRGGAKAAASQPARKPSPPKRTSVAAPQNSPPPAQRPSQVPKKEPPKAPRPSPQTSPPKAAQRRPPQAVKPRPPPKSPKKDA